MTIQLELEGRSIALSLRHSPRARRVALRLVPEGIELVVPPRVSESAAIAFARERGAWILRRMDKHRPPITFADGIVVPFLGVEHRVRHMPARRGTVERIDAGAPQLQVAGAIEHLPRRLGDWLKAQTRQIIEPLALEKSRRVGKPIARIAVRNMRTRWGSCSRAGALSFSWRIVMAPPGAIDWLVAHEVAHLVHMNHRQRFWDLAHELTAGDFEHWRAWLRSEGELLLRYGL